MIKPEEMRNHPSIMGFRNVVKQVVQSPGRHLISAFEEAALGLLKSLHMQEELESMLNQSLFGGLSPTDIPGTDQKVRNDDAEKASRRMKEIAAPRKLSSAGKHPGSRVMSEAKRKTPLHVSEGEARPDTRGDRAENRTSEYGYPGTSLDRPGGATAVERLWRMFAKDAPSKDEKPGGYSQKDIASVSTGRAGMGKEAQAPAPVGKPVPTGRYEAAVLLRELKTAMNVFTAPGHAPDRKIGRNGQTGIGVHSAGERNSEPVQKPDSVPKQDAAATIAAQVERLWNSSPAAARRVPQARSQQHLSGIPTEAEPETSATSHAFAGEIQKLVKEAGMRPLKETKRPEPGRENHPIPQSRDEGPVITVHDEELADAINRQLVEQARRSGVEI